MNPVYVVMRSRKDRFIYPTYLQRLLIFQNIHFRCIFNENKLILYDTTEIANKLSYNLEQACIYIFFQ